MADNALITCLWFDTEGEAAATYYTSIFKDSKLGRVSRYTEAGPRPAGMVMEVEFELNGPKVRRAQRRAGVQLQRGHLHSDHVRGPG
jgi:predicted 3-demethylubiquinone-9 3-methyltransferase (glyoxalase superfamily)